MKRFSSFPLFKGTMSIPQCWKAFKFTWQSVKFIGNTLMITFQKSMWGDLDFRA